MGCLEIVSIVMVARQHFIILNLENGSSFMKWLSVDYLETVSIVIVVRQHLNLAQKWEGS